MKRLSLILVVAGLVLTGCGDVTDSSGKDQRIAELEAALQAEQEQAAALESHLRDIKLELKEPDDDTPQPPAPPPCPSDLYTFASDIAGNSCDTYQAQIRGWSEKCVAACNQQGRLAEATADANATCQKFCGDRGCPVHRYAAPANCAPGAGGCANSNSCPAGCKKKDRCYLEQGNVRINCWCETSSPSEEG